MLDIRVYGENALLVRIANPDGNHSVQSFVNLKQKLDNQKEHAALLSVVPGRYDLTIIYDQERTNETAVRSLIQKLWEESGLQKGNSRTLKIPVCYELKYGLDLIHVAEEHACTPKEIIKTHCSSIYQVELIGFLPGFPYLSSLEANLSTQRREVPRTYVPAGSIGLADEMCGIYPIDSPGGWKIIGRTPLKLIREKDNPPFLFRAGDRVQFYAIDERTFDLIEGERQNDYDFSKKHHE